MKLCELLPRERQIVRMLAEGAQCKDVAVRLNITVRTTQSHMQHIYKKTGTHGVVGMLLHFYEFKRRPCQ